jgi:hypothetical protein
MPLSPLLVHAARMAAALLIMRLLPFAVYVVVRQRSTVGQRAAWVAAYAGVAGAGSWLGVTTNVILVLLAAIYYFFACIGVCRLSPLVAAGQVTRGGVLAVVSFVFLFLPGVLLPGVSATVFLVVGWDLVLSSYSYCIETSRPGAPRPSLGEGLFFLLVNPTLVYTVRGRRTSDGGGVAGWSRVAIGLGAVFADVAFVGPVARHLCESQVLASSAKAAALFGIGWGLARFVEIYAAQSGLASLRIGLMRQIGWVVPECYRYPAAATSPMDFWRRWNIYVRTWLEAYVFLPLARRVARRTRRRSGQIAAAGATLVVSGALHIAYSFAGTQSLAGASLNPFIAAGAFVAIWSLLRIPGRTIQARLDASRAKTLEQVSRVLGWSAMTAALIGAAMTWG